MPHRSTARNWHRETPINRSKLTPPAKDCNWASASSTCWRLVCNQRHHAVVTRFRSAPRERRLCKLRCRIRWLCRFGRWVFAIPRAAALRRRRRWWYGSWVVLTHQQCIRARYAPVTGAALFDANRDTNNQFALARPRPPADGGLRGSHRLLCYLAAGGRGIRDTYRVVNKYPVVPTSETGAALWFGAAQVKITAAAKRRQRRPNDGLRTSSEPSEASMIAAAASAKAPAPTRPLM